MKFLLSAKEFKEINKEDLVELYKELYDRYFCQHVDLRDAQMELKKLRQEQAEAAAKKTAVKQFEHDASKAYERIKHNHRVMGKPMTTTQLKTILSFMAERDYGFSTTELIGKSALWASALINKMMQTKNIIPKIAKPYSPEEVYCRFIAKYPEWYKEVITK